MIQIIKVGPARGECVETEDDVFVRYESDSRYWWEGSESDLVPVCSIRMEKELEEAYQKFKGGEL